MSAVPMPMPSANSQPNTCRWRSVSAGSSIISGKPMRNSLKRGRTPSTAVSPERSESSNADGATSLWLPLRET